MAVLSAAHALGKDLQETARNLFRYKVEDGRLEQYVSRLPSGDVRVIDDSWNAETISMLNAFSVLKATSTKGRKIAVLGRIVHLGDMAEELHASLAEPLLDTGTVLVVTHGEEMKFLRKHLPERLLGPHFDKAPDVYAWLERHLASGDLVLLKGSRRDSDFKDISTWLKERIQKLMPIVQPQTVRT
jgi:UDP-N-acetylmuramyl pentapeptide synthase